jgi:hypothetical protein
VQSRRFQMMEPSSSPARTLSSQDFSFGDRVRVLGLRGVRQAADGVGGMLGLASSGLGTLDTVRFDEAGRRRTLLRAPDNSVSGPDSRSTQWPMCASSGSTWLRARSSL